MSFALAGPIIMVFHDAGAIIIIRNCGCCYSEALSCCSLVVLGVLHSPDIDSQHVTIF